MNRIFAIIVLCLVLVTSMSSQALSFDANTTNSSIAVGDTVVVDVSTSNFNAMSYYQFTMEWDSDVIELVSLVDCNSDINLECILGGNYFNETAPGIMRSLWSDGVGGTSSLSDNSKLFTLRFKAKAEGDMNIRFSDNGIIREANGANGFVEGDELLTTTSGLLEVGANGGGGMTGGLTFNVGTGSGAVGETVCIPVSAENFSDLSAYQFIVDWDETVLSLTGLENCNSTLISNCAIALPSFNEVGGVLRHIWVDGSGGSQDLTSGTVLFELCFEVLAAGSGDVEITDGGIDYLLATDGSGGSIEGTEITVNSGTITGTANGGGGMTGGLTFNVGTGSGAVGETVCIPVSAENFSDLSAYQFIVDWDETVLSLTGLENCNNTLISNCAIALPSFNEVGGVLRHIWVDGSGGSQDLTSGTVLFELCFEVLAAGSGDVEITDGGIDYLLATDGSGGSIEGTEITVNSGTITGTANGGGGMTGGLTFNVGTGSGAVGETVCIPVSAENFSDLSAYQFIVDWDETVLSLTGLENCNNTLISNCAIALPSFNEVGGVLRHIWVDGSGGSQDLTSGTVLFELCFEVLAAGSGDVEITDGGIDYLLATDGSGGSIEGTEITVNSGTITGTANGGGGMTGGLTFNVGTGSGAVGETVCIPVSAENFSDLSAYQFIVDWDETVLSLTGLENCNNTLISNCAIALPSFNEVGGVLRHIWVDGSGGSQDLTSGTVLFELCFEVLAAGSGDVEITDGGIDYLLATDGSGGSIEGTEITVNSGTITGTANGGGGMTGGLTFNVGTGSGAVGETVCIPVSAENFSDLSAYQFIVDWDETVLSLTGLENCNSTLISNCAIALPSFNEVGGVLRHIWVDGAGGSQDLTSGTVLFELCFEVLAAGSGDVEITDGGIDYLLATDGSGGSIEGTEITVNSGTITGTANGGGGMTGGLTFNVGTGSGAVGETVCIPVSAENFSDLSAYQFIVDWDETVLSLTGLENCNNTLISNCAIALPSFNEVGGVLRHIWVDGAGGSQDLTSGTVLFELCFEVLAAGSGDVEITDGGIDYLLATDGSGGSIEGTEITVNSGTITGTANGGGGEEPTGPLRFSTTSANVAEGGSTCLNIMVDNFIDITSFSFSQTWDASVFELEGIMSCSSALTGLDCGLGNANFALVGNNRVDITWSDASGATIPTGELLFQICLKAIGEAGEGTNVAYGTNITVNNKDGVIAAEDIETQDAQISINGTTNNGLLSFFAQEKTGDVGEQVCLEISTDNFEDIVFFQYTMEWDESVLSLANLDECNTELALNCDIVNDPTNFNQTSTSSMRASWRDRASVGKTLPDGSLLYEICFDIIGEMGDNSLVQFTSNEIDIEAQRNSDVLDADDIIVQNGLVTVNGSGNGGGSSVAPLVFNISEEAGRQSDEVCVAITAENFDDIIHFQYNIEWNSAVLQFVRVDACNTSLDGLNCIEGNTSRNFNLTIPGLLRTSWLHPPTTGLSIADDVTLFEVCFRLVGNSGASSAIQITDTQLDIEASNPDGDIIAADITLKSGRVDIVTVMPVPTIDRVLPTDLLCNASNTGAIDIDVSGGVAPLTYKWSNGATTQDVSSLANGTYRVSVTDGENRVIVSDPIRIFEPAAIAIGNVQVTGFNSVDNIDGAIDIAVSGGTTPYSFVWSNGATTEDISGLDPGCYSVVITDRNGCELNSGDICVEDEFGPLSAVNATPVGVFCSGDNDGSIAFSFSGGEAPFTIALSTGEQITSMTRRGTFENLPVGSYTIDITDALNETVSGSASVGFSSTLTATSTVESDYNGFDISAFGRNDATISAMASGSDGSESYLWSDNLGTTATVNNVAAGTYTVSVTDGTGCTTTSEITVTEPQLLRVTATADLAPGCKNICEGEASANVEGGVSPYSFAWSTGSTQGVLFDLCAGNYTVSVTDANDVTTVSDITIVEPDSLKLSFETMSPTTLTGNDGSATVIVSGGTGPFSHQWNDNSGTRTPELTGIAADTYFVIVTDANGCQEIGMVEVKKPTASCYDSRNIITIDADGINDNFIIQCADTDQNTLQIFNRWGQLVFDATNYDNTWEGTDKRGNILPSGGYFWVLRVTEANGDISIYKDHLTIITED